MEQSYLDNLLKQIKKERAEDNLRGDINLTIIDYSQTEQQINDFDLHTGYNFDISGQFIDLVIIGKIDVNALTSILRSEYKLISTAPLDAPVGIPVLECPPITYFLLKKKDSQDIIEPLIADVEKNLSLGRYANSNPYAQRSLE